MKKISAWLPIVLSIGVLAIMLIYISIHGVPRRQPDEGVGAHLFQIWLVVELIMMLFFAIKWLPQKPKEASLVLVIQIIAAVAACAPVFYFNL